MSIREDWIDYLIDYYAIKQPKYNYTDWRRWAESKLNKELEQLGDYFSRSHYEK